MLHEISDLIYNKNVHLKIHVILLLTPHLIVIFVKQPDLLLIYTTADQKMCKTIQIWSTRG